MTKDEFTALVEQAEASHPIWFGLESDRPATEADLARAEATLKVELPQQYREFLREYGGGDFAFTNVFSLDGTSDWDLLRIYADIGLLCGRLLAISDNQVGDYYGFVVEDGRCSEELHFHDHEDGQIHTTEYADLYSYIARTALRETG